MKIPITSVVSCTGCVFVTAGSPDTLSLYDKRQEQTGNWTSFEQTDPDGRWPYASKTRFMSAATYQRPEGPVGYVTFSDANGQLYAGAPVFGNSGPLLTPPLPPYSQQQLATPSYIVYVSNDWQLVFVDFAQIMGIAPLTDSYFWTLRPPPTQDQFGFGAAAQNAKGLLEVCGTYGVFQGWGVKQSVVGSGGVHWSELTDIPIENDSICFSLCLLNQTLHMFLFDGTYVWVKLQVKHQVWPDEVDGGWGKAYVLNSPPFLFGKIGSFNMPTIIASPHNSLMLFWISSEGELWRGESDGTYPLTWKNAGSPRRTFLSLTQPAVSIGTTGNIEVFVVSGEGDLWQMWQTTETGVWSDWYLHGQPSD
jgi:hypothetical protein